MDHIRIFYSWQSDREQDVCGRLIQIALQGAIDALQSSFESVLILDSDTVGVAGTPPVSETILRKIRTCDIFVGDVSFVGATERGKLLPNPNVMTEFGFARSVLDDQQLLLVMNTAFGPERELPFDLAHLRHPLAYMLAEGSPDGERRRARAAFMQKLVGPLEASIRFVIASRATQSPDADTIAFAIDQLALVDQLYVRGDVPAIVNGPRLILRVASAAAAAKRYLEPSVVKATRPLFIPRGYERYNEGVGVNQWSTIDPPERRGDGPNPESRWFTRLIRPGVVETAIMIGARIDDDRTILVDGYPLESRIAEVVLRSTEVLKLIGLDGPLVIAASLMALEDVQLATPRRVSRPLRILSLFLGQVEASSAAGVTPGILRPLFDAFWLSGGFDEGTPSFENGEWQGDAGGPLYEPVTFGGRT